MLTLQYADAVHATGVEVVENQNPGAVVRVELVPVDGSKAKWTIAKDGLSLVDQNGDIWHRLK